MFARPAPCGGNRLLAASCDRGLYCVDRSTGRRLWRYAGAGGAYHSSPVVAGSTVYAGNDDGRLHAVGLEDGRPRWTARTEGPVWTPPAVWKDRVMAGTLRGWLAAHDRRTGRLLWKRRAGRSLYLTSLVPWRDLFLATTTEGALVAFRPSTGEVVRRFRLGHRLPGGLSLDGDTAFLAGRNGACTALHLPTGRRLWRRRLRGGTLYAPGQDAERLYAGTGAGLTYALAKSDGRVLWRHADEGRAGCCLPAGGRVFSCSWNGSVRCLDRSDGSRLWSLDTDADVRGFPLLLDGRLYIGSLDFRLYAVALPPERSKTAPRRSVR